MSTQPISLPAQHNSHNTHSGHSYNGSGDYPMASGSYTGSSNGSFNPASYMRHFIMGSPMAWRTGSFGSGNKVFISGSPMDQLVASIDPNDSRYRPSSFEQNRDSIMNALNVFDPTDEIARDYTCCGCYLNDMHELLEHFEEVHVIYDASFPEGQQAQIKIPFNPQPVNRITSNQQRLAMPSLPATAMLPLHTQGQMTPQPMHTQPDIQHHAQYPGSFDTDGMDLDMDVQQSYPPVSNQSSPSSGGSTPPDTPVSTPLSTYPSPTISESPKTFFNGNSQQVMFTPQAEYANSPFASPFASQPPSPQRHAFHEADGGPAVAFDTFSARPQPGHSTSSLDGALGDPIPRPQLSVTLTPFSRPSAPSSAHPGALNPLTPYARYQAHFGIPGAEENSHPMVDANADGYRSGETSPVASSVAPAMLFSNSATPISSPSGSRVPSPTPTDKSGKKPSPVSKAAPAPAATTTLNAAAAAVAAIKSAAAASKASSSLSRPAGASLLLSKPFKCPKPNCNKSYKQANGLKYHITHGSCNFAPPKDLEHVQAILERKRRDKAAAEGVTLDDDSTNASPSGSGLNSPVGSAFELGISDAELRDIEREAEKKLKPFACTIGDCTRRYKNMNGLRYHYQHTGEHGAIGLGLLASGQHECLKNNSSSLSSRESSTVRDVNQAVREGRKIKLTLGSSKPGSRASSTGKEVKPKVEPSPTQVPPAQVPTGQVSQPTQFTVQAMSASSFSPATSAQAQVQAQAQLAYQQRFMDHQRAQFAQQQQQQQMIDAHAQNHMQAQILAMQNSMYNTQISSPPVTMAIPRKSSSSLDGALDG